jgi:hypothetical protein
MRTRTRMKTRKRLDVSFSYRRHVVVLVPAQGHEVAAREARPREVKRDERRVQRGHRLEDARSRGVDPARAVTVQVNHRRRGRKLRLTPAPAALARVSACGGDSPGGVTFRLLRCAAPDGALQRVAFVVGDGEVLPCDIDPRVELQRWGPQVMLYAIKAPRRPHHCTHQAFVALAQLLHFARLSPRARWRLFLLRLARLLRGLLARRRGLLLGCRR